MAEAAARETAAEREPEELEAIIGYRFRNRALLERALTSPSCRMVDPNVLDNQRLEFLGDAVLGLLSADAVFSAYPDEQEGPLTVRRTHLVSGAVLGETAERLGLRDFLRRNRGAGKLSRRAKPLSDAVEAVMGAVWLDGGLEAARQVFRRLELPIDAELNEWSANPKGFLQVKAQSMRPPRKPVYTIESVTGPAHQPKVTITVEVEGLGKATATAISKTAAEVAAADALLTQLKS